MPDKPQWYREINEALQGIAALPPGRNVTASELAIHLKISTRRAQQILKPLTPNRNCKMLTAPRIVILEYLRGISDTDEAKKAQQDFERFQAVLRRLDADRKAQPPVLIEAPASVQRSQLDELEGVRLEPGRIVIEGFTDPDEARRKLLALAFAIGNDPYKFDQRVALLTRRVPEDESVMRRLDQFVERKARHA